MEINRLWDCIIIGGGPAGLTAALYLARYHQKVAIYDTFQSRAMRIPTSHNYPGFPDGISGENLLTRLRDQLAPYKVPHIDQRIESIQPTDKEGFILTTGNQHVRAKYVLLCTGVVDIEPRLANINDGVQRGLIRHCPVCDAYEVNYKKIAVIGNGKSGLGEALFLRDYTEDVTLMTLGKIDVWTRRDLQKIREANISVITEDIQAIELTSETAKITFMDQRVERFDSLYSALGAIKNTHLIQPLNVHLKDGWIVVNKEQETSVKGLFAAGDIVQGLNQICVATSQAAIASTAIHKRCRQYI